MVGKRRRSPRLTKKVQKEESDEEDSPPPKRRKLQKTATVELEEEDLPKAAATIDRKTSSFLQSLKHSDSISSISSSNKKKLLSRLSSIMNPTEIS